MAIEGGKRRLSERRVRRLLNPAELAALAARD